ncbi:centromere protein N isoform X1 [Alexandromys fortis]|uniref:centromere protein N isoform X1 n=1 Tax=Alexandromys fortis TaxID=100897 RepID=UPI0021536A3C|nr:centromere protein N isoform X1 [Microtus fortis]XP_049999394.1 centromere protein N isoform X1 [Microtus fortis]
MDENVAEFLRRSILKIPLHAIKTILKTWDFLSENQLETINLRQRKESLAQEIILLCEGKNATLDDMALLDIVYTQVHRHKKLWDVFEMSKEPGEDVDLFDMKQFQASFKKILQRALKNVSVNFRVDQKNAVWIRVAWGTQHSQPNQYKPTFVVYYPQTPYAFISTCPLKSTVPLLHQALKVASKHHQIVHLNLKSRLLDSLKAIVFREYNQNFDSHNTTVPLQEGSFGLDVNLDSNIILENTEEKERIQRVTQETFGTYPQPQLEFAQYKLETRFKSDISGGILADRKEPLRCLIKFSSPHLLEALKSLAPAGIADAPLSPLLTCIPSKKMNYFKIRDK